MHLNTKHTSRMVHQGETRWLAFAISITDEGLVQGWSVSDSVMAVEGLGWLPTTGNLACLSWLFIALYLNWQAKGAPDEAIFLLAPSLLLLSRDPLLLPGLTASRRYAPCSLAVSVYLLASGLASVVHATYLQPHALATAHKQTPFFLLLNMACLAAVVPVHLGFLQVRSVCLLSPQYLSLQIHSRCLELASLCLQSACLQV